jgi:DNA polymerase alpha subunit A
MQVAKPQQVTCIGDADLSEAPPLTLMSLALRTVHNAKDNKQEIVAISARIYENVSISDATTDIEKMPQQVFTVVRPVQNMFPAGFEKLVERHPGNVKLEKTENMLLSSFLAKLQLSDPDVLMGHSLDNLDWPVLLHRMKEKKTPNWSRVGRLKRTGWPNTGKFAGSFFVERQLASGRLLCDLANDLGKSLMTKCQSWSLTEMCDLILGKKRQELDNEDALKSWAKTNKGFLDYLIHCEVDTYFIAAVALKIQMLPLTKQLTNLAGNSWARTLSGTRAERNEYILLHEFHRGKYICPDKVSGKGNKPQVDEENAEGEETGGKKKDKYKGGLVFEPEKGLYDKYVIVMDFNSLYPSIIQEFNICFTTVERSDLDGDKVPDVPGTEDRGVLPRLIATLVDRRKQVKGLMKDKNATAVQKTQWDIKQQALKLTANSMYGCLGYVRSRFYARPLAMLITFKGRQILQSTKDLAESMTLQVIYGDTDSVMINTLADNYADALKIGNDFKKQVNDRYRLLEIDIDNVFQRLLLHAKKKYAAMNCIMINGKLDTKMEVKGLDMRRREYCQLSKEASSHILNEVFTGDETEVVVERIHDYLRDLAQKLRGGTLPLAKYTIYTRLGKNPEDYPNGKSMPQVQVALRKKSRGEPVKAGDVISYIITGGADDMQSDAHSAERAYATQDVLKPDSGLKPDPEWYIAKQIFPPIERLCAPIEGTNSMRLAECLGLDLRKYQMLPSNGNQQDTEIHPLESTIPDEERFKDAVKLSLQCRSCKESFLFEGLVGSKDRCSSQGISCKNASCGKILPVASIVAQVDHQLRQIVAKYHDAWLVCNSCGLRTRQMSVYGKRCLGPKGLAKGCKEGRMTYEYSDKMLYNQLLYFRSLFDAEKAVEKAKAADKGSFFSSLIRPKERKSD